jgi:hypothetical protein
MAAQSTALTEFATLGDSRTWTTSGHSTSDPKLVIQKRKVPSGNQVMSEVSVAVVHATDDADGAVLPQKASFTATVRYPIASSDTAVADALLIFRDIVAGDEFGTAVTTQNFLA